MVSTLLEQETEGRDREYIILQGPERSQWQKLWGSRSHGHAQLRGQRKATPDGSKAVAERDAGSWSYWSCSKQKQCASFHYTLTMALSPWSLRLFYDCPRTLCSPTVKEAEWVRNKHFKVMQTLKQLLACDIGQITWALPAPAALSDPGVGAGGGQLEELIMPFFFFFFLFSFRIKTCEYLLSADHRAWSIQAT